MLQVMTQLQGNFSKLSSSLFIDVALPTPALGSCSALCWVLFKTQKKEAMELPDLIKLCDFKQGACCKVS